MHFYQNILWKMSPYEQTLLTLMKQRDSQFILEKVWITENLEGQEHL